MPYPPDSPTGLTTNSGEMLEHERPLSRIVEKIGLDVVQDRLLGKVEPDYRRHVGVDGLVVRNAGADGIGDRDAAGAIRIEQPGHTQCGVGFEGQRIEVIVVHAPVDHVHALEASGRAGINRVVVDDEVTPFDEIDGHLVGEKRVLVVGRVVDARGQEDDMGVGASLRCNLAQMRQQCSRILIDRAHMVALEQLRVHLFDDLPVREHVRHAARHAQVVLEHQEPAVRHHERDRCPRRSDNSHAARGRQPSRGENGGTDG